MSLAPIVLFVYSRPQHTLKTLSALAASDLAAHSHLHIYCDGPRDEADPRTINRIRLVRNIVRHADWCGQVTIHESNANIGLAGSVVRGVSETVAEYGHAIILEDDIVVSKGFLRYMNHALAMYVDDERVFQVSGFMVPTRRRLEPTGFFCAPASWGWATWDRAWSHYDHNLESSLKYAESIGRHDFNLASSYDYYDQLLRNLRGDLDTWGVRFYSAMRSYDALALYPARSYVRNIGFDELASNTQRHSIRIGRKLQSRFREFDKLSIAESPAYYEAFLDFYRVQSLRWSKPSVSQRIRNKIGSVFGR